MCVGLIRTVDSICCPTPHAQDTLRIAAQADRRFSGFTCYAALAPHRASNIEDVSYQVRSMPLVRGLRGLGVNPLNPLYVCMYVSG